MTRFVPMAFVIFSCSSFAGSAGAAESQSSTSPQDPPAATSSGAQASSSDQPTSTKKPKKIWTNDDIAAAQPSRPAATTPKDSPKKPATGKADAQYIANTKKELAKLQGELSDIEKQLSDLKDFQSGKPAATSAGYPINKGYNRMPVDQQITNLEDKKKNLQAKIDDLLDETRKRGVEPGQLR